MLRSHPETYDEEPGRSNDGFQQGETTKRSRSTTLRRNDAVESRQGKPNSVVGFGMTSCINPHRKAVLAIAGLLVFSLTLSSCDTLRQKFTRKKKPGEEEQTIEPVLEPEEYPAPEMNPQHNYIENYELIKAWYHDLWTALDDKNTARYTHYIIAEVTNHISQMEKLVDAPTQANLVKLAGFLDYYQHSLDGPWQMRDVSRIQSDLRAFDRFMRDHLRADRIKGHFVQSIK